MKKLLLSLAVALTFGSTQAQNLFNFGFDGTVDAMTAAGWQRTNQSSPSTATVWTLANYAVVPVVSSTTPANPFGATAIPNGGSSPIPLDQAGNPNQFGLVNYTSTSGAGTISNWLISPTITVQNGDVISFYTRLGRPSSSPTAAFPDNLEMRMSTNGDFTANPTGGSAGLGDFTMLLVQVNPNLDLTSYPTSWTQYSYTVEGLTGETAVKIGFRYYVTNGGPAGDNSDIIGIDTFSVDRALSTQSFFTQNYSVYPNPASDVLNVSAKNNVSIKEIQLTDVNGRIVKTVKANETASQINIADLNAGVYFLKVTSDLGTGTTKVVKN